MDAQIILTAMLAAIWIWIFLIAKELRKEMLTLGILSLFLLPITFTVGVPGIITTSETIFIFCTAGIAGVIFHFIAGKHYHRLPTPKKTKEKLAAKHWLLWLVFIFLAFAWSTLLLQLFLNISGVNAGLISAIGITIYTISHRHDLLANALWSAFLTMFGMFITLSIGALFSQSSIDLALISSTHTIAGMPTDILIWSAAIGLFLGPVYEFTRHQKLTNN